MKIQTRIEEVLSRDEARKTAWKTADIPAPNARTLREWADKWKAPESST